MWPMRGTWFCLVPSKRLRKGYLSNAGLALRGGGYFPGSRSAQPSCIPVPVIEGAELCHIIKLSARPGRCLDFWWELLTHALGLHRDFINTIVKQAQMSCAGAALRRPVSLSLSRQEWKYQSWTLVPPTGILPPASADIATQRVPCSSWHVSLGINGEIITFGLGHIRSSLQ